MSRTFDYHFILRKPKHYQQGDLKVYIRISVNGQRCETATSVVVDPNEWDIKSGRVKGRSEKSKSTNSYLDILQSKLYDSHAELLQANVPITAEVLRNQFNGKR